MKRPVEGTSSDRARRSSYPESGRAVGIVLRLGISVLIAVFAAGALAEQPRWQGIFNGGFERGLHPGGVRPAHWNLGFPGDDLVSPDAWRVVFDETLGTQVVEISCQKAGQACLISQVADLPVRAMTGRRLAVRARMKVEGAVAVAGIQVVALNPEVPPDPLTGVPHVGFLDLHSTGSGWMDLTGEVELIGVAELVAVALYVVGDGALIRVDDVLLEANLERPSCSPSTEPVLPLADGLPPFRLGLVNENPRSESDRGRAELTARAADVADLVNLFAHVRWNGLRGSQLLDGHETVLDVAGRARELGLDRMLTLDFTYAALEGLGDINPIPDGTPVESLDGPTRAAYLAELEALVVAVGAEIVSVGIETNFFW